MTADRINLHILNLTVTLRCNLRCRLCVADVSKYKPQPHFELDYLRDCIDKCFSIVDYADRFQLSGGEPLLHHDLDKVITKAMTKSDQFGFLGLFTNGTIMPPQELIDQILEYNSAEKFMFYISDYGVHSPKAQELKSILDEAGLPYDIKDYSGEAQHFGGWVDYGDYQFQNRTTMETAKVFNDCAVNQVGGIWSCRFGQIHRCTRSASGISLGLTPNETSDYIDLFDNSLTVEQQREKMMALYAKPYISCCGYCSGDFGSETANRYPAGEQIE